MGALAGKRILLVEDEFIIAALAADMLVDLGATVVGPAATVAEGLALAETASIDAAVLDVNMYGERVGPVAAALRARGIPFIFATGYGENAQGSPQEAPILDKPYSQERLGATLARVLRGP